MKRQGYRDSLHTIRYQTAAFSQPGFSGAAVLPPVIYGDIFRTLSINGGRQLSQSQTARVVGMKATLIDAGTDEQTTTGVWATGVVLWFKPTSGRVAAHELAMKEWFGELEEDSPGLGAGRWRQFLVKITDAEATLPEHSLDGAAVPIPFALSSAAPAAARDIFGEYAARFPMPPDLVGAGIAQRQPTVYASPNFETWQFTVAKGAGIAFPGLGANVDPLARSASTAYTHSPVIKGDEIIAMPGHHFPFMCGKFILWVQLVGPRALTAGNAFESGSNTVPDQTPDSGLVLALDLLVEGWHPLRRQKPGESRR